MSKKSGSSEQYVLSEAQLQKLWKASTEIKDKVLVGLLAYCGMRIGEAVHWRQEWIREGSIHIPASMPCDCYDCKKRGNWQPKSKASNRSIPIPRFLAPILYEYLHSCPKGLEMCRQAGWYRIQRLSAKAGIPQTFCHSLRATCASMLAGKGLTGVELCYIMGWKRLEMGEHYIRIAQAKAGVEAKMKQIWG